MFGNQKTQRLTIGSLFSGIGGLELGLEWAGLGPVLWQVEKDEYCRRVLAKHWPGVKRYEDVKTVGSENLERVDLICGGFPCQDISCAGRGAGIKDGTRSGLWFEFARVIRELRPRVVVVENVPALLARGMDIILGDLAALGYDAWWDCIPAQSVGAPHRRDRVFVVAYTNGSRSQRHDPRSGECCQQEQSASEAGGIYQTISNPHIIRRNTRRPEQSLSGFRTDGKKGALANADSTGQHKQGTERDEEEQPLSGQLGRERDWRSAKSSVGRTPDGLSPWLVGDWEQGVPRTAVGVPDRVDRLRALGNAVVPQVAQVIGEIVKELANA